MDQSEIGHFFNYFHNGEKAVVCIAVITFTQWQVYKNVVLREKSPLKAPKYLDIRTNNLRVISL
jgi:hypothetical protein